MEEHEVVYIKVDPTQGHGQGKRATMCETLLGFIPGHFLPGDTRIMIAGIVHGGAVMKMGGGLQVGDWLVSVNDLDVSHDNINALLSAVSRPKKIKLTVQPLQRRPPIPGVSSNPPYQRSNSTVSSNSSHSISSSLLRPLGGPTSDGSSEICDTDLIPHVVMYLTTETAPKSKSGSREDLHAKDDDVIYAYPKTEKNKLAELRGLFETLPQLLTDVTDNVVKLSTLKVYEETLHVAYFRCEPELLVFGVSANHVSAQYLRDLTRDLSKLLLVIYGSLQTAFKDKNNQTQMDQFLKVFLGQVLAPKRGDQDPSLLNSVENEFYCRMIDAVKWMPLDHSARSQISSILSNYESADFAEISDDYYDIRRHYTIVGTTLFYNGYLISSHLPKEDLLDISLYLKYTSLLQISATQANIDPIVVWREAFPTRRYHDPSGDAPVLGYSEPVDARWFLLIVGHKKMLLTALLEAGGCSQWAEGPCISPNPFYVEQAKSCLQQLESIDVPGSCELALNQYAPTTAIADLFISNPPEDQSRKPPSPVVGSRASIASNRGTSVSSLKNDLDNVSLASSIGGGEMRRTNSINSIESGDSSLSSTTTSLHEKLKGKTSSRFLPSLEQLSRKSSNPSNDGDVFHRHASGLSYQRQIHLSAGANNSLFHYLYFQEIEGIFIEANNNNSSHSHPGSTMESAKRPSSLHGEIVSNFYSSALTIRRTFEESLQAAESGGKNRPKDDGSDRFAAENAGRFADFGRKQRVYEEGILFHFTPAKAAEAGAKKTNADKNSSATLTYWVVGRLFLEPEPQQLFVCFQDGVEQNLVELAFKLGFGVGV